MLFPILMSTSKVSRTRRLEGKWNSTCRGRKTWTSTDDENRRPLLDTVKAHRDHLPASCGAEIVNPVEAISDLKEKNCVFM